MVGCNNKVEHNCGSITYARCVRYESEVSENSSITGDCKSTEDTTQDIYNQLDNIDSRLDFSSIESSCITFTEPKSPLSVIAQIVSKLCDLEELIESQAGLIETLQGQVADLQDNPCN